ncbi:MAG TPA: HU family DNA-binding protein [Isosphaeraceae bacterium]|jgi:nucleoid DNA-binding protein|nr:HU family DNA-binding protein [Isosphaeraceae bacterium]
MAKKAAPRAAEPKAGSSTGDKGGTRKATKGEIYARLAEHSGLTKKQVASVFEGLTELIKEQLGKKGPKEFTVPGLLKLKVVHKPATKAKQGINPFTKEPMMYKAKPARNVVKALVLKSLKEMV